jgi:diguanylate cyclase (GGDEF)-like protein
VAGDEALKRISEAVRAACQRQSDLVFRLGGEEFGIWFEGIKRIEDARTMAQNVVESVAAMQIEHRGNEPWGVVTISLGAVFCQPDGSTQVETLYRHCDAAMYRVKERGRNGWDVVNITEHCREGGLA